MITDMRNILLIQLAFHLVHLSFLFSIFSVSFVVEKKISIRNLDHKIASGIVRTFFLSIYLFQFFAPSSSSSTMLLLLFHYYYYAHNKRKEKFAAIAFIICARF
jgi:hypothetical protein